MTLTPRQRKHALFPALVFVAMMVYVGIFMGTGTGLWSCPFRAITSLSCFGCGMTRALSSIARGDLVAAWNFNALSIPFVLVFAAIATTKLGEAVTGTQTTFKPVVWARRHERPIWLIILAVVLLFGVTRMAYEILV